MRGRVVSAVLLTAAQMRTLSTHAVKGAATVCALGLPDQSGPVVVADRARAYKRRQAERAARQAVA